MKHLWVPDHQVVLYRNCRIRTLDDSAPIAEAMVVQAGRILWVGREADLGVGSWSVTDLEGATVLPGLRDGHTHFLSHAMLQRRVNLRDVRSESEAAAAVMAYAERHPGSGWIQGHGWNENGWEPRALPSRLSLDAVCPDRPVVLSRADGHMVWVNSAALRAAGISATTLDPAGGQIDRAPGGEPTGLLRELAAEPVWKRVPPPSVSERVSSLREAQKEALSYGLVGLHTMEGRESLEALQELNLAGELTLRVLVLPPIELRSELQLLGLRPGFGDAHLRLGQLKLFVDGSLGSLTAWMLEDLQGAPGNRGIPIYRQAELVRLLEEAHLAGWPCAVHAIGDAANRAVLYALEAVPSAHGPLPDRIEHVQAIRPEDAARLARTGAVASMQPVHVSSDWREADRLWGGAARYGYAWRTLADAGAILAFGSDAPVELINPWAGIQVAVTRQDLAGEPAGGWYPDQRLGLAEALGGFSRGVARAGGEPAEGRLAAGAHADFMVLERDPFAADPAQLAAMRPLATYVAGEPVWSGMG